MATQAGESGARDIRDGLGAAFAPLAGVQGVTATPTNENIIGAGVVDALQESQVSSIGVTPPRGESPSPPISAASSAAIEPGALIK